jgi:thioester reductase-like protein
MATFLTGATGYIGAHIASELLNSSTDGLNLLVRAKNRREAEVRLWRAFQLHMDFDRFLSVLHDRLHLFLGDLTGTAFGLAAEDYGRLAATTDSIIHCAASLNRKSEKSCLNVNLRGTLEVVKLALRVRQQQGLRRISHVSTVAVAGHRCNEIVQEETSIDWDRSDYDPYARTKKFCEHMIRELLPDVPRTIFRPSIVLGDSRRAATTQFDMVRAFVFLANLPFLPFRPEDRLDIVPVDYVADSVVSLHLKEQPQQEIYHLSSGTDSETFRQLTDGLAHRRNKRGPIYLPALGKPFTSIVNALANWRGTSIGWSASLLKVFMPYLVWNTVFDNHRVVSETGRAPVPFSNYSYPLMKFSRENGFAYPYKEWPAVDGGTPP